MTTIQACLLIGYIALAYVYFLVTVIDSYREALSYFRKNENGESVIMFFKKLWKTDGIQKIKKLFLSPGNITILIIIALIAAPIIFPITVLLAIKKEVEPRRKITPTKKNNTFQPIDISELPEPCRHVWVDLGGEMGVECTKCNFRIN